MKPYQAKCGRTQYAPSLAEIEEMEDDCAGFCLACGETQSADSDARRDVCESCGKPKVYGPSSLAEMGLCYDEDDYQREVQEGRI